MSKVRLRQIAAGTADFEVIYGETRAWISLQGLKTTGGPEETTIEWEPFYRERLKELCEAIQASTDWRFSGCE